MWEAEQNCALSSHNALHIHEQTPWLNLAIIMASDGDIIPEVGDFLATAKSSWNEIMLQNKWLQHLWVRYHVRLRTYQSRFVLHETYNASLLCDLWPVAPCCSTNWRLWQTAVHCLETARASARRPLPSPDAALYYSNRQTERFVKMRAWGGNCSGWVESEQNMMFKCAYVSGKPQKCPKQHKGNGFPGTMEKPMMTEELLFPESNKWSS